MTSVCAVLLYRTWPDILDMLGLSLYLGYVTEWDDSIRPALLGSLVASGVSRLHQEAFRRELILPAAGVSPNLTWLVVFTIVFARVRRLPAMGPPPGGPAQKLAASSSVTPRGSRQRPTAGTVLRPGR